MNPLRRWIIQAIAGHLPPCSRITHQLSENLEGRLTLRERIVLRLHLSVCSWCTRYGQHIAMIKEATHELARAAEMAETPRKHLSEDARRRLREALDAAES